MRPSRRRSLAVSLTVCSALVAGLKLESDITGDIGVQLRRAGGDRGVEARYRREVHIVDLDEIARVFSNCRRLRDDQCNWLTDVTHAFVRKYGMMRLTHLLPVLAGKVDHVRQRLESGRARIVARINAFYAVVC